MNSIVTLRTLNLALGKIASSEPFLMEDGTKAVRYDWDCGCRATSADGNRSSIAWCVRHGEVPGLKASSPEDRVARMTGLRRSHLGTLPGLASAMTEATDERP